MAISLSKGQKISLSKAGGDGLSVVAFGVGWDVRKSGGFLKGLLGGGNDSIDLDASCLLYAGRDMVDAVWFRQLRSQDGSILHSGDNRTGEGDGDDETIVVRLTELPANVDTLVLTVNSFTGEAFDRVDNAYCRAYDHNSGTELGRISLSEAGPHTGLVLGAVRKIGSTWEFKAIGERATGRTFHDMAGQLDRIVSSY
jgi:tellurium resistance protein TerZ